MVEGMAAVVMVGLGAVAAEVASASGASGAVATIVESVSFTAAMEGVALVVVVGAAAPVAGVVADFISWSLARLDITGGR